MYDRFQRIEYHIFQKIHFEKVHHSYKKFELNLRIKIDKYMKSILIPSDIGLRLPVIMIPIGDISEKGRSFLNILKKESFPAESYNSFQQVCQLKNVPCPESVLAKIYVCDSDSNLMMIRNRLQKEKYLFYLNCFIIVGFIDYTVNKDVHNSKERTKNFCVHPQQMNYIIYQADPDANILKEHSDRTHISFYSFKEKDAIVNIRQFLVPLIFQSIQTQIIGFPSPDKTSLRAAAKINAATALSRYSLLFLSDSKDDQIAAFSETLKALDSFKDIEPCKHASIFELMAMFEIKYPKTVKEMRFLDRIPYITPLWTFTDEKEKNDVTYLYSIAASIYSNAKSPTKMIDCLFRLFHYLRKIKSTNSKMIINLILEATNTICSNSNDDLMQCRAFELMEHVNRLGYEKRIPLLSYKFGNSFKDDAKLDFQLQTIEILYKQSKSEIVLRDLCGPIVSSLLKCALEPSLICKMIFRLLSAIGQFLSPLDQEKLFTRLIDLSMGDLRIPCDIGLSATQLSVISEFVSIQQINNETNASGNSGPIFLYNGLTKSKQNEDNFLVGVGNQFRIEFYLYNPFGIDLPTIITGSRVSDCITSEYHLPLQSKFHTKAFCCFTPLIAKEYIIDSIDCAIYEGVQKIKLPRSLKLTAIEGVPNFSVRTDLPLSNVMNLYDGEILNINLWITNSGNVEIENLTLKFSKIKASYDPIKLPIKSYTSLLIPITLEIDQSLPEIKIEIIANSKNTKYASFATIIQPIHVEAAVSIVSIEPLTSLPEIDADFSNISFVAADIKNYSDSVFNYSVAFESTAKEPYLINFPGIISKNNTLGVLSPHRTTSFILALDKSIIKSPPSLAPRSKKINAAKMEEEKLNKKLSDKQRSLLDKRVEIATFIEENLKFMWNVGSGRRGKLATNLALPSVEMMEDSIHIRPCVTYSFECENVLENKIIQTKQKVILNVFFNPIKIEKCELQLGVYQDSDYGVIWNGMLEKNYPEGVNSASFELYFIYPGKFHFKLEYSTIEGVHGHKVISLETVNSLS
ncbi:hypothetical protein TRFO_31639 [Tritrichomonas foetus]|uniref:Uncharacterized protein n=1 Tax=Tritrichomonas foetus TaxID=1144522 RepID=A0A1J4JQV3_9EUKA|nr:hypothetical protein TRFO_31639 [Tritrichomonas foetus]|eukprot:OHT01497.1 hypothetical protein TRFO_31639 [Tritrichomonas foetus]